MILSKNEQRENFILTVARAFCKPIWVGDVAQSPLEQEAFRPAFNSLVERGLMIKQRVKGTQRVYYSLVETASLTMIATEHRTQARTT